LVAAMLLQAVYIFIDYIGTCVYIIIDYIGICVYIIIDKTPKNVYVFMDCFYSLLANFSIKNDGAPLN